MLNQVIIIYLLIVLILFTAPIWVAFIWRITVINRRKKKLLKAFCEKYHLTYQETQKGLRVSKRVLLSGKIEGQDVQIYDKKVGFGRRSHFVTHTEIGAPDMDFHFYISKENIFSKVKEKIGKGDIQIGNELIDSKLYFHTENEDELLKWLKATETELAELLPTFRGIFEYKDGKLTHFMERELKKRKPLEQFEQHLLYAVKLANAAQQA